MATMGTEQSAAVSAWVSSSSKERAVLGTLNGNLDSAYCSDESPTLISPLRCGSCRTIPARQIDRRLLPCGHFFCAPCAISCSPQYSLTLYCPICGDQSIAPFQNESYSYPSDGLELGAPIGMIPHNHQQFSSGQTAKDAWARLQTFSEAYRRRIDDWDRQRRFHSPTRSSDTHSNISELEELEESLNTVIKLLQGQTSVDRSQRILGDLRTYENQLKSALTRLNAPNSPSERDEQWRRSFADAKTVLRTLSTRAKLESQRLVNEDKHWTTRRPGLSSIDSNGKLHKAHSHTMLNGTGGTPSPDPPTSPWTITVNGEGIARCRRGVKNALKLNAKNGSGEPVNLDRSYLSAYLVSASTGKRSAVVAIRETASKGLYELSYYVNREGAYHLIIKFAGHHVGGSPFPIRCTDTVGSGSGGSHYEYYNGTSRCSVHSSGPLTGSRAASGSSGGFGMRPRTFTTTFSSAPSRTQSKSPLRRRIPLEDDLIMQCGGHGRAYGQFSNPQGICCSGDGVVYVADSNNQCVQGFDLETGQCKLRFGRRGRSAGEMQRPTGVAVLPSSGNVLVADYDNRWISVHDSNGKYLGRFGSGKLLGPRGIALDADNHAIIVDNKASAILVYDLHKFKFVRQFGTRGDRLEQLAGPHYCAVNPINNFLYFTDFHHHCVKVFDCHGQYQFAFGSLGEGNGQFQAPTGITIDANQNVLVADWGNSRIQVFDHSGSFLSYVNSFAHPLFGPQGLTMTSNGTVAVADTGNHCYKIYRFLS